MSSESLRHLTRIYQDSDPYVGWNDQLKAVVLATLKQQEIASANAMSGLSQNELDDPFIKFFLKISTEFARPDKGVEGYKSIYGFSSEPNMYPDLLKDRGIAYYTAEQQEKIKSASFGILPTIDVQDFYDDSPQYMRLANAFAFKVSNDCYVAAITTQLSKVIMDWSVIIGSTTSDLTGEVIFCIPIEDIIPALSYLVNTRWLNEEAPPTLGMKYMPEDIMKEPMWFITSNIMSYAIHFFFTHHEAAHIVLGHLDENNSGDEIAKKSESNEIEADIFSAHITACYLRDNFRFDPDDSLIKQACIGIVRFVVFTAVLDKYTDANTNIHPSGYIRARNIIHIFKLYFPAMGDILSQYLTPDFNNLITKRINND